MGKILIITDNKLKVNTPVIDYHMQVPRYILTIGTKYTFFNMFYR